MDLKTTFWGKWQISLIVTIIIVVIRDKAIFSSENILIFNFFVIYFLIEYALFLPLFHKIKKGWVSIQLIVPEEKSHIFFSMQRQAEKEHAEK